MGWSRYCSKRCARVSQGETLIERLVREELQRRGVFFDQEVEFGRWTVDFYLPMHQAVIEADGTYWHSLERAKRTDQRKDAYLRSLGIEVFRFTEAEIKRDVASLIDRVVGGRRKRARKAA